ncbi:MAG: diguanylate cyclase [Spirochaetales bacterium]|nr:diguanylate cyclase [Spirochaetales bacterium]
MEATGNVPGVRIGKIADLAPLGKDRQNLLLPALARGAEVLSSGKGWPDGVSGLIADLGRITGVNRVWLFQILELSDEQMLMNFPFEWVDDQKHALKKKPRFDTKRWKFETCSRTYRTLVESRRRGEWQTALIGELEECDFKDYQTDQGVQSTVSIPVMVQGEWWGLLGLDDCSSPHQWSDEEIALLRMTAHLISNAVLLNRLSSANRQFEILSNLTESSAWELDFNTAYCWFNSKIISRVKGLSDNLHQPLRQVLEYIHPDDLKDTFDYLRNQLRRKDQNFRKDLRIYRDGQFVWSEVIAKISLDSEGRMEKMSGIMIDIPERKEREEELYRKASLDPLTRIANRGSFDSRFTQMIEDLQNKGQKFSLLLLDIDDFKKVNDTWGHAVGDKALKHVTRIMQNTLRDDDFAARFGGEEFVILLHCDTAETSESIAERIRCNVEAKPLVLSEGTVPLTISIGIFNALEFSSDLNYETILNKADEAMYEAKKSGRNRVVAR